MLHNARIFMSVLLAALGCASTGTSLSSSWRSPEVRQIQFRRAVTSFVSMDVPMRRSVEERLATRLPGTFPAYSTIPDLSLSDPAKARAQLRGKLFDGAVVVRLATAPIDTLAPRGKEWYAAYPTFVDSWGSAWKSARDLTKTAPGTGVSIEVLIYSLADDKLLWAGRTETTSSGTLREQVDHSVDAVVRELWMTRMVR